MILELVVAQQTIDILYFLLVVTETGSIGADDSVDARKCGLKSPEESPVEEHVVRGPIGYLSHQISNCIHDARRAHQNYKTWHQNRQEAKLKYQRNKLQSR